MTKHVTPPSSTGCAVNNRTPPPPHTTRKAPSHPNPDDGKARLRASRFAWKWWAEQRTEEPTDAAMRAAFAFCVRAPRPELYPLIREAIVAQKPPVAAAPLFAALAAYQTTNDAALDLCPRELHTLACHLETLPLAAPTVFHAELREARDAAEHAWESLRIADTVTSRDGAHHAARAAVRRARSVIVAIAPRAIHMHGTDMPATSGEIRAAARAYNAVAGTPEELAAIETGVPEVRAHCGSGSSRGWTITAGITSSLGLVAAHPPLVVGSCCRDGRKRAADSTRDVVHRLLNADIEGFAAVEFGSGFITVRPHSDE